MGSQLQWKDFPLTECIAKSKNSKFDQATRIYKKFLDSSSICPINISGAAHDYTAQQFAILKESKNNNEISEYNGDIKSKQEFEERLLTVFDGTLSDVISNLNDILLRFQTTKE